MHDKHFKSPMQHVNFSVIQTLCLLKNLTLTFNPYSFTCSHCFHYLCNILKRFDLSKILKSFFTMLYVYYIEFMFYKPCKFENLCEKNINTLIIIHIYIIMPRLLSRDPHSKVSTFMITLR